MRESFTPEEVDRIEEKAYEVGVGIGATQERERIIALLEHERYYTNGDDQFETAHSVPCVTCKNIALIKGENK
ncbi:MAG: hypothetical protein EBU08_12225 [Micrococcales bacterium]|nr:hypothetical protein [Micrococcales bacterium]